VITDFPKQYSVNPGVIFYFQFDKSVILEIKTDFYLQGHSVNFLLKQIIKIYFKYVHYPSFLDPRRKHIKKSKSVINELGMDLKYLTSLLFMISQNKVQK